MTRLNGCRQPHCPGDSAECVYADEVGCDEDEVENRCAEFNTPISSLRTWCGQCEADQKAYVEELKADRERDRRLMEELDRRIHSNKEGR